MTREFRGLPGVTWGYTGLQGLTRGLKVVARGYKKFERVKR